MQALRFVIHRVTDFLPEDNGTKGQLYNLKEDLMETRNFIFLYPEKAGELSALLKEIVNEEQLIP